MMCESVALFDEGASERASALRANDLRLIVYASPPQAFLTLLAVSVNAIASYQ